MLNQTQIRILDKFKEALPYMTDEETNNLLVSSETLSTLAIVRKDKQQTADKACTFRGNTMSIAP